MRRFIEEADRGQSTLLFECLDDFIDEGNPVRVIDVFVDALDLAEMGFDGVDPAATGRPSYHPSVLLKLYIYGYLNRVQSSRRLEREAGRNVEVMWLLGRLVPDHKTIADFRKDNGLGLRKVCARFDKMLRRYWTNACKNCSIKSQDVGEAAARRMLEPAEATELRHVEGPRPYTPKEVAAAFGQALGKTIDVAVIPREEWEATFLKLGFSRGAAASYACMTATVVDDDTEMPDAPERGSTSLQEFIKSLLNQ